MGRKRKRKQKRESVDDAKANPAQRPSSRFTGWIGWVISLATTALMLVLVEGILAIAGVRPADYGADPYVGFSSTNPLFVEVQDAEGRSVLTTAANRLSFFNPQTFPKDKQSTTYRIFCVGGSTTFGRPYDDMTSFAGWLREMLPRMDPSVKWEVINAGGISYASYRVALLMEELAQYEPDLFIVYTGHNEFLEKRTYGQLSDEIRTVDKVRGLLSKTRMYTVAQRIMSAPGNESTNGDETGNLLPAEVVTRLEKSKGPKDYFRDDPFEDQVLTHFRFNLNRTINIAQAAGAQVLLVTPASNLRDCSPFKSQHRDTLSEDELKQWQQLYDRADEAMSSGNWNAALTALDAALALDDRYAHAYYRRGKCLWELQRYADARASFIRARDEDVCPLRALTPICSTAKGLAAERDIALVDFLSMAERMSPHGVPGTELFLDHVHPTVESHRLLALAILDSLEQRGVVHPDSAWGDERKLAVKEEVEGRLDPKKNGAALRNLAQVLGWAGKFEESKELALQAIALSPQDGEAHYIAAWNAQVLNEPELAAEHYRKALEIRPGHEDSLQRLEQVLASMGDGEEAIQAYSEAAKVAPDDPAIQRKAADALLQQGKIDEAAAHYQQVLDSDPADVAANNALGGIMLRKSRFVEAIALHGRALEVDPNSFFAHYGIAEAFGRSGRLDAATDHYMLASKCDSNRPEPYIRLALLLLNHPNQSARDPVGASEFAERAVRLTERKDATALHALSICYAASDRLELAISTAKEALRIASASGAEELAFAISRQLDVFSKRK